MVWARTGAGSGAREEQLWDEARAAAERRWRQTRGSARPVTLPSAHDEPTVPPGVYRWPAHLRDDRTPTPRLGFKRRPEEDPSDLEPTQKRRAPVRRPSPSQPIRTRSVTWGKPLVRSAPPPIPPSAHSRALPPAVAPPPPQSLAFPAPSPPARVFALPPEPVVVPVSRPARGIYVIVFAISLALGLAYQDIRTVLARGFAATDRLNERVVELSLAQVESQSRIDRELAALRASLREREVVPPPAAAPPQPTRKRRSVRLHKRVVAPAHSAADDDPLAGVKRTRRVRPPRSALEF